jgi:hypothetical protein
VTQVAALYVDPGGPYPRLLGPEFCWDEVRDARTYVGPWPVVAHPPCGPWSRLRHLSRSQAADCAVRALEQVRACGGVLEHPAHSGLFAAGGLPLPGELPDAFGGRTVEVCQSDFGHVARKRTWLYFVGCAPAGRKEEPLEPTHWVSGGRRVKEYASRAVPDGIRVCSSEQRRRTPISFAAWLIIIAGRARGVVSRGAS